MFPAEEDARDVHRAGGDRVGPRADVQGVRCAPRMLPLDCCNAPVAFVVRAQVEGRQDLRGGELPQGHRLETRWRAEQQFGVLTPASREGRVQVDRPDARVEDRGRLGDADFDALMDEMGKLQEDIDARRRVGPRLAARAGDGRAAPAPRRCRGRRALGR